MGDKNQKNEQKKTLTEDVIFTAMLAVALFWALFW